MNEPPHHADLQARLVRHAEALRIVLNVREFAAADDLRPYDEELHAAGHRLLTTIDLMTQDVADPAPDVPGKRTAAGTPPDDRPAPTSPPERYPPSP